MFFAGAALSEVASRSAGPIVSVRRLTRDRVRSGFDAAGDTFFTNISVSSLAVAFKDSSGTKTEVCLGLAVE